jgi:Domain of unknown function (DUF4277)
MSSSTPGKTSRAELAGGMRHQMVLWLNQMRVVQPILEQLHLRETVRDALQQVQGEEATVVESGRLVEVLVLNRLTAPRPLYRVGEWRQDSVLAHRLGLDPAQVNDARLGRVLDALDGVTATIWPQVVAHALALGGSELDTVSDDSTSFSFAGAYDEAPEITYGSRRDGKPDTQQLEVGRNVTAPEGLPLAYRLWAGNTADARTPVDNLQLLRRVLAHVAPEQPVPLIISDRAMLSLATLAAYEAAGGRSLGPLPDSGLTAALLDQAASTAWAAHWAAHPLAYRPARDQRGRSLEAETAEAGVYAGVRLRADLPLPASRPAPARGRDHARPDASPSGLGRHEHAQSKPGCHAPRDAAHAAGGQRDRSGGQAQSAQSGALPPPGNG